jgi:hypothetical protein
MAMNIKHGTRDPVVTARRKYGVGVIRSNRVDIVDAKDHIVASIICDIDKPLNCGARCYVETRLKLVNAEKPKEVL